MVSESHYNPKKQTKTNSFLGVVLKALFSLVIALLFSIAIEFLGMNIWWQDEGVEHSRAMVSFEMEQFQDRAELLQLSDSQLRVVEACMTYQKKMVTALDGNHLAIRIRSALANAHFLPEILKNAYSNTLEPYIEASINVTKVFALRLATLILSIPLFIIALFVAVVDGLVERDLRKWGAGRESSTVFHLARSFVGPMAIGAWIIYLSIPFSIDATLIILPFVVLFAFSIRVTTERMKKYF